MLENAIKGTFMIVLTKGSPDLVKGRSTIQKDGQPWKFTVSFTANLGFHDKLNSRSQKSITDRRKARPTFQNDRFSSSSSIF